jgi:membrane fusion protein (multidrug efflux system)
VIAVKINPSISKALQALAALVVTVLLILWMSGWFASKVEPGSVAVAAPTAPADAATTTVIQEAVPVVEEAAGTVQAERRTLISSRILAVIGAVRVGAGQQVSEGDVLIELDDRELVSRVREATRAVEAIEADRARRRSDLERARTLREQGVVSQSEFDQAESAFKVVDAERERARQALQAAEISLSYTRITAPVSGRIIDRLADPGDTAVPGKPLLSLYDPSALRMEVPVRESLVSRLRIGDPLEVRMSTLAEALQGVVDEIVPQAEAGSRTFLVKVGLPKRDGMYTGMFGRVVIPAGERTRVLLAEDAIEQMGQLTFVSVVGQGRVVTRRLITLGQAVEGGRREVLSGLRANEVVLLPGVRPGS